jgi:hypothetical protein
MKYLHLVLFSQIIFIVDFNVWGSEDNSLRMLSTSGRRQISIRIPREPPGSGAIPPSFLDLRGFQTEALPKYSLEVKQS